MKQGGQRGKPTMSYPSDVGKAMQLLSQGTALSAEELVGAFTEVREDAIAKELQALLGWLRQQPCPTPGSWPTVLESLENRRYRETN